MIGRSREAEVVQPVRETAYVSIPFRGKYTAQKVAIGDLDGDGRLDYVTKQPNFNTDPYQRPGYWKKSEDTYKIEAYRHNGAFLWRHDMGWSIEEGIWYSPYIVYDIDGDGKAEVYCKAGEGDPRDEKGLVQSGPEWLAKLDPLTGKIVKKIDWPSREGFSQYNYYCRNLLAVAYLNGENPSLICQRGTYRLIKTHAYDKNLDLIWKWAATEGGPDASYRGKGSHGFHAADIDSDGCQELVFGSAALDEYGHALWNTGKGHPDVIYVADVDPKRPGLEVYMGIETRRPKGGGVCLHDAKTGEQIWGIEQPTRHVHGQGMCADISSKYPGMECYGKERDTDDTWLMSAAGERIGDKPMGGTTPRAAWWDDSPQKALVIRGRIFKYDDPDKTLGRIEGRIIAIADCLGDWREEIITSVPGELRIYTTTIPATTRRTCLMQDRQYRVQAAAQSMGYLYPPNLGLRPTAE
jgi:rhamnogalacturonan endolyase